MSVKVVYRRTIKGNNPKTSVKRRLQITQPSTGSVSVKTTKSVKQSGTRVGTTRHVRISKAG